MQTIAKHLVAHHVSHEEAHRGKRRFDRRVHSSSPNIGQRKQRRETDVRFGSGE